MKPTITSFLDYNQVDLNEQLKIMKKLNLSDVVIRKVKGAPINHLSDEELSGLKSALQNKNVIAVDPLLFSCQIQDSENLKIFNQELEKAADRAKSLRAENLIYTIPKFDDLMHNKDKVLEVIKHQVSIIKKRKLSILIKPDDNHKAQIYRFVLEQLKDVKVKMIFDPVYLYKIKDAMITAFRLLRDYIGLLLVDDVDPSYASRLIGTGKFIELNDLFKRFVKSGYAGYVVLDSGLVEQHKRAQKYKWYETTISKRKRHEKKILFDFTQMNQSLDTANIIKVQLAVLYLVFLNKKIALN